MTERATLGRGGHSVELCRFAYTLQYEFAHLAEKIDRENAPALKQHRVRSWLELVRLPSPAGQPCEFRHDGPRMEWGLTLRYFPFPLPACLRCESLENFCRRRLPWAPLFPGPPRVGGRQAAGLVASIEARHLGEPPLEISNLSIGRPGARPWIVCLPRLA